MTITRIIGSARRTVTELDSGDSLSGTTIISLC